MLPSEQNDAAEKDCYGHVKNEQPEGRVYINVPQAPPSLLIDAHTHIQSSRVAPLPCAQKMVPVLGTLFKLRRSLLEGSGILVGTIIDLVTLKPFAGAIRKSQGKGPVNEAKEYYESFRPKRGIEIARQTTHGVGLDLIYRFDYARNEFIGKAPYEKAEDLDCIGIIMPMDMEYAHLDGYYGIKIYNPYFASEADKAKWGQPGAKPAGYWYPIHGRWQKRGNDYVEVKEPTDSTPPEAGETKEAFKAREKQMENEGLKAPVYGVTTQTDKDGHVTEIVTHDSSVTIRCLPCKVPDEEADLYEPWFDQVMYTEQATLDGKLKLLPLYHYDPRRWQAKGNGEPFAKVGGNGLYLGFKIYTAQGYRPWDPRLPIQGDFYKKCAEQQIPIMNHCTPGGAITYDMKEYLQFTHKTRDTKEDEEQKAPFLGQEQLSSHGRDDQPTLEHVDDPEGYFQEHFVSPRAWQKVLEQPGCATLRLCLAHFGGNTKLSRKEWHGPLLDMLVKYPNLYVDISSSFTYEDFREYFRDNLIKNETVKQKILFGSDWYMSLLRMSSATDLTEYFKPAKEFIEGIDKKLWLQFSEENPCKFYKLEDRIGRIAGNVKSERKLPENKQTSDKKPNKDASSNIEDPGGVGSSKEPAAAQTTPASPTWKDGDVEDIEKRADRILRAASKVRAEALINGRPWS